MNVLGLRHIRIAEWQEASTSKVLEYNNFLAKMMLATRSETNVNFIQHHSPPATENSTKERSALRTDLTASKIANIGARIHDIVSRSARKLNSQAEVKSGRKTTYVQDPDGNWIERVQTSPMNRSILQSILRLLYTPTLEQ